MGAIVSGLLSLFTSNAASKAIDLVDKHIEDPTKRDQMIAEIIKARAAQDGQTTIPLADAIHKLGRQFMWWGVIGFYMYCKLHNIEINIEQLAMLSAGPGLYTLMKGKGA